MGRLNSLPQQQENADANGRHVRLHVPCRQGLKSARPVVKRLVWAFLGLQLVLIPSFASGQSLVEVTGRVRTLRVEGHRLFVELTADVPACPSRMWTDVTQPNGRAIYATALLAAAQKGTVTMRGFSDRPKEFGACPLYDIILLVE